MLHKDISSNGKTARAEEGKSNEPDQHHDSLNVSLLPTSEDRHYPKA